GAERLAFNEMFRWVKANARREKIKAILAHKLDRVCRNMRDAVRLQELEDGCGVQLAFVDNEFGPGAAGALSFNVMAAVAQYYSDNLRTEVLKGMDEKVRQGWPTGLAPYGYLNVDDKDEPVQPHPEESRTVVRVFELYATGKYTFDALEEKLAEEGFVYRPSQPRFSRSALSHILNNRFYAGELLRNGNVHAGKYRLLIDRQTFQVCQDILSGKDRRMSHHAHLFSGGLLRCAHCGFAMTGELIRRKLLGGAVREHTYYRCASNRTGDDHPPMRWREEDLEEVLLEDFRTLRMPEDVAEWFRTAIQAAFQDVGALHQQKKQALAKRRTELVHMQDRLLNAYLAGTIEEAAFQAKTADLKRQA
ncbi:MAG: recombinase family protein, partial [Elusimicrobiota bacterium]